jgi:hypothetical protein
VDEQEVATTSDAGSPKQEGKRGGARGRRQRRGGRAVEDPQATRGLVQWLEVELGARRWQWAAVAEREQRGSEANRGRRKQTGVRRTHLQIEKLPGTPL